MQKDAFFFVVKNQPNFRAPVVCPSPDLCGIYRVVVLLYNFGGVAARRDAQAEFRGYQTLEFPMGP